MPIYEFACRACHHEFETLVRPSETPSCERCASPDLDKKPSVFATSQSKDAPLAACGTCGHPGGPGSCALD